MRIEPLLQNSDFFTANPFTVQFKYQNPFTNAEVIRKISLSTTDQFKLAFVFAIGLLLGVVGAPILFFYAAKKFRERQIQEIKDLDPKDSKIQLAALERLFGREYVVPAYVQDKMRPSKLPLDWNRIQDKCTQIKLYAQLSLHLNQKVDRFTESVVVIPKADAPLKIEEMEAAFMGKLDSLSKKILSSGTRLDDQQYDIKAVGLLKLQDGTWGFTHGYCNGLGTHHSGDAFKLTHTMASRQFKRYLNEFKQLVVTA